ncbi:thiolase family protein [Terracidiphilus gabretensis]|jgi:acetyl-CoA C-acetyltransferase|uniref:thiolase family protein n=1 Tax=Terracidiphilus gabretensis TaxID=1577687 RepID=UPI00071BF1AE|nr:acetyl-CoA C-acetyltransferase [Terracidiphilus gabretensis]
MREAVIVSAVRTPVGKFQGSLSGFTAPKLGALVVREAVRRSDFEPGQIDECIMGCVLQAGLGQNPARQAAIYGGLAPESAALTVNQVCGSGLRAASLAAQAIALGDAEVMVAGGMESMTNVPYLLPQARGGYRLGNGTLVDAMIHDGLWEAYRGFHMGVGAEMIAEKYGITREEQDAFAAESHRKAAAATRAEIFAEEMMTVEIPAAKKGEAARVFAVDEAIRPDTTVETLAKLKPAFKEGGTVTAGNAPGVSDGAAAVVITSAHVARERNLKPLGVIRASATAGREPEWFGLAPIDAVLKVTKRAGWELDSVDRFELNEAFAVQAIAVNRELGLDASKVNVHGGSVAVGHPIGSSGARLLVRLLADLKECGGKRGIVALCLGGGNAVAMAVERID